MRSEKVRVKSEEVKAEAMAEEARKWRRMVLRIGITTQCRTTYDICANALKVKSADEMIALAMREGVTP